MLIPYGWGDKLKKDAAMGILACDRCSSFSRHYLGRVVFKVHICYIPVFWRTKGYYVFCENCEGGVQISKEQYRNMKPVFKTFSNKKLIGECYNKAVELSRGLEPTESNVDYVFGQLSQEYPINTHDILAQNYRAMVSSIMNFQLASENQMNG